MELSVGVLGMSFSEALLSVLAIIAFVIAVAFVLVVLVDLLLSIIDPNSKGIFFRRHASGDKSLPSRPKVLKDNELDAGYQFQDDEPVEKKELPQNTWDDDLASQEQQSLLAGESGLSDEASDNEHKDFHDARVEAIERRRQEFEDFDTMFENEVSSDVPEADELNKMIEEINAEAIREYNSSNDTGAAMTQEPLPLPEPFEDTSDENIPLPVSNEEVVEPVQEQENFFFDDQNAMQEQPVADVEFQEQPQPQEVLQPVVPVQQQEAPQVVETVNVITTTMYTDLTLDQLNERLNKLQNRLKQNEKDLKANRKEYLPLARVKRTLEKDQQKLRRREAVIARKKVILYGVNNYVDIDEEKAKKLSEDLDLLDGLRLSVQHCEDVMAANKDRFPILEKTNKILTDTNKDLKDDIAEIKAAIEQYKRDHNIED